MQQRPLGTPVSLLPGPEELEEGVALLLEDVEGGVAGKVVAVVGVRLERDAFDRRHVDVQVRLRGHRVQLMCELLGEVRVEVAKTLALAEHAHSWAVQQAQTTAKKRCKKNHVSWHLKSKFC